MAATLGACLSRVARLYEATQVELHGQYSVERLHSLHAYSSSKFSASRLIAILLATPAPCLAVILLLEAAPLEPPSAGISKSLVFWVRMTVTVAIFTLTFTLLCQKAIPTLQLSTTQLAGVISTVTTGGQTCSYVLSLTVGFPVPFVLVVVSPVWLCLLLGSLYYTSGRTIRESTTGMAALRDWTMASPLIVSLLFVYPLYNYAFISASPYGQSALSVLLAVIKIAYKNAIARCIREQSDLKAEIVTFHVEISNALFVTFSMQNASSVVTLVVLLLIDFLHACATLYEVHRAVAALDQLEQKIRQRSSPATLCDQGLVDASPPSLPPLKVMPVMVHRASVILSRSDARNALVGAWAQSSQPSSPRRTPRGYVAWVPRCFRIARVVSSPTTSAIVGALPPRSSESPLSIVAGNGSAKTVAQASVVALEDEYAQKVLQLLHLTEFTVLTEFIEFVVPLIYALYAAVMVHLPNRVYFPQLSTIESDSLGPTVTKVVVYSLLELCSLFLLDWMLQRRLRFSPIVQLAFVLDTFWKSVQAELVLWVVYIGQASLEHYGADYTFAFSWLSS